jgi:hypothetical protein
MRAARRKGVGLPEDFRFHDLRHICASLLIVAGLDVKTVQHRLRHGSATTTLNTHGHLWPDRDDATRSVVRAVLRSCSAREDHLRCEQIESTRRAGDLCAQATGPVPIRCRSTSRTAAV